jgi:hypothetical protein
VTRGGKRAFLIKRKYDGIGHHPQTTSYCSSLPRFQPSPKPETSYLTIKITASSRLKEIGSIGVDSEKLWKEAAMKSRFAVFYWGMSSKTLKPHTQPPNPKKNLLAGLF